jgi:hypothetical protein
MKLSIRTRLYMRFVPPLRVWLRNRLTYMLYNAIDRLDIDKCTRYNNAVTFRDFIADDDLFTFDDDGDWN